MPILKPIQTNTGPYKLLMGLKIHFISNPSPNHSACSQDPIEWLNVVKGKVECHSQVGHLQRMVGHLIIYLVSHPKVDHVKKSLNKNIFF